MSTMSFRSPTEVRFSGYIWLKRYKDQKRWNSIREDQVILDAKKHYPFDWERIIHNAKEGLMGWESPYIVYMWLPDPAYQDELPK